MTKEEFRKRCDEQGQTIFVRDYDSSGTIGTIAFSNLSLVKKAKWVNHWWNEKKREDKWDT